MVEDADGKQYTKYRAKYVYVQYILAIQGTSTT